MPKRTDVIIRKATINDVDAIVDVERDVFTTAWSRKSFEEELNNIMTTYLVVETEHQVVGYAGFWLVVDEAQVTNVAIKHDWQSQGLGRKLMQALLKEAKLQAAINMSLEVRESNFTAQNLYETLGFSVNGLRPNYYLDDKENAILMNCVL